MPTSKKTVNWYNKNAKWYTAHVRNPKESVYHSYYEKPAMYALVPNIKNKTVLSLGCGSGEDSSHLKKLGAKKSVGIDISAKLIKIAKDSYPECSFKVMDMEHLKFPKSSFDFIYSSLAINYTENWTKVFEEVYRVLKPNSYFLFSCGHPVRYAMESVGDKNNFISKLEIVKNRKTKKITVTGNYLERTKLGSGLGGLNDSVITWHKPFSEISSELSSAGFLIEKIIEPKPLKKLKKFKPETYKKLSKIPEFVIFRLLKL
jgi:ubiquinone/menaquinone biosynthesis C-methylase UbiE